MSPTIKLCDTYQFAGGTVKHHWKLLLAFNVVLIHCIHHKGKSENTWTHAPFQLHIS